VCKFMKLGAISNTQDPQVEGDRQNPGPKVFIFRRGKFLLRDAECNSAGLLGSSSCARYIPKVFCLSRNSKSGQ
jgi:hypothetical protein